MKEPILEWNDQEQSQDRTKGELFFASLRDTLFLDPIKFRQKLKELKREVGEIDADAMWNMQIEAYEAFILEITGKDIGKDKENDPSYKVTGKTFAELVEMTRSVRTDDNPGFVSAFGGMLTSLPKELKIFSSPGGLRRSMYQLQDFTVQTFNENILNDKRNWKFGFGFTEIQDLRKGPLCLITAILNLETDVVNELKTSAQKETIQKELENLFLYFNHDVTVHGIFLPLSKHDHERILKTTNEGNALQEAFNETVTLTDNLDEKNRRDNSETFLGEILSNAWHRSLVQELLSANPALLRLLRLKASKFLRAVDDFEIEQQTANNPIAADAAQYLREVYAFGFFRLIPPALYEKETFWRQTRERQPGFKIKDKMEQRVQSFEVEEFPNEGLSPRKAISVLENSIKMDETLSELTEAIVNNDICADIFKQETIESITADESVSIAFMTRLAAQYAESEKYAIEFSVLLNAFKKAGVSHLFNLIAKEGLRGIDLLQDEVIAHYYNRELFKNIFEANRRSLNNQTSSTEISFLYDSIKELPDDEIKEILIECIQSLFSIKGKINFPDETFLKIKQNIFEKYMNFDDLMMTKEMIEILEDF